MGAMHHGECASFHRAALWNGPVHGCSSSYGLIPYHTAIETLEFVTSMSKSCGIEFWMMMFRSLQPEWRSILHVDGMCVGGGGSVRSSVVLWCSLAGRWGYDDAASQFATIMLVGVEL